MAKHQKARYLVSPAFVALGAKVVCRYSVGQSKFVTITTSIWSAVARLLTKEDFHLAHVAAGLDRSDYLGNLAFHLGRSPGQAEDLRQLTRRLSVFCGPETTHIDAIICGLTAAAEAPDHDLLAPIPSNTVS